MLVLSVLTQAAVTCSQGVLGAVRGYKNILDADAMMCMRGVTPMLARRAVSACAAPARALSTVGRTAGVRSTRICSLSTRPAASPLIAAVRPSSLRTALFGGKPSARRFLCTEPPKASNTPSSLNLVQAAFSWARQNTTTVAVIGGAALVMYGFYRFSVRIMKFFFNVSDKEIFTLGFVGGFLACVFILGAGYYTNARLSTSVDGVYRAALAEMRKREAVQAALGGAWRPSGFKGYKVESLKCVRPRHYWPLLATTGHSARASMAVGG